MKIAFVTNICPHYRVKTFEMLAQALDVRFFFFSAGDEWYWQQQHGVNVGKFQFEYLSGFRLGHTRITPQLFGKLIHGGYDVYIKCINGRFALPVTYLAARIRRKPFILWTGIWTRIQTPVHRIAYPLTRYIYRHADAVVVYGEHVRKFLVGEGVDPERIFVTTHAVDNDQYNRPVAPEIKEQLRQTLGINDDQKIVLYLGRLEASKGVAVLVDAFACLENQEAVLVIAGTGSEEEALKTQAAALGLRERVRFAGYVSLEQTPPYYALADVFVLPSITTPEGKEPWGLVVNEAFNQGLPVIASDAVGAAAGGLVEDGVNGLVVPEGNAKALAAALDKVLEDDPLRDQMSQQARKKIDTWSNQGMVDAFVQAVLKVRGSGD
jgi:glycosyltransferase involved in cell wall biosynthesis